MTNAAQSGGASDLPNAGIALNYVFDFGTVPRWAALVVFITSFFCAFAASAHGRENGGHCYNDWHYMDGSCHAGHGWLGLVVGGVFSAYLLLAVFILPFFRGEFTDS
jgi:hypothetical protein